MNFQKSEQINYSMISLFQYLFAILVILLHAQRVFSNDVLHFIQKSIFSRMAVPFFIVSTSFFLAFNSTNEKGGLDKYFKKSIPTYSLLSLLYLPYAFLYFLDLDIPFKYLPIGLLLAITYFGMCYHLWYFPAIFLGLKLTAFFSSKFSKKIVFIICLLLYLIGTLETYSAYLSGSKLLELYEGYKHYFLTTRNGLFYVPIYVFLGQFAFDYRNSSLLMSNPLVKLLASFVILLAEASVIYFNQGDDKNFFISLIPFTLFLFNWISRTDLLKHKKWSRLKTYSVAYYFFHPIFIEIGFYVINQYDLKIWEKGIIVSIFTLVFTHTLAIIYHISCEKNKS